MKDNKKRDNKPENKETEEISCLPLGMCIGLSIGVGIGASTGNIPIFMSIGLGVGIGIGALIDAINRKKNGKDE